MTEAGPAMTRQDLLRQLAVASELEHGLCLQYLFTAASMKDSIGEGGLTETELLHVRAWKASLNFIASQEMLHLAQACNLLAAVGGAPHLRRPNFPQRPGYYPTGLPWGLWPLRAEVIELYAFYERPVDWRHRPEWAAPGAAPFASLLDDSPATKDPFGHLPAEFGRPSATPMQTIGQLYQAIADAISTIPGVIIGDPARQLDGARLGMPQLVTVLDVDDALRAIDLIVEQGEGRTDDRPDSHLGAFLTVRRELAALSVRPGFQPGRDVAANPLSRLHVDNSFPGWRLIQDPDTRAVNDLTSAVYRSVLDLLHLTISGGDYQSGAASLRLMTGVLAPLTELLTQLPMGEDGSPGEGRRARFAGPSFELTDVVPEPVVRQVIVERLLSYADRAEALAARSPAGDQLGWVAESLREIATSLT